MLIEFDIGLISMTVWGEARGEEFQGKLAVAYVIFNRIRRLSCRASQVVLKPYQFSFWNTDDPSRPTMSTIDHEGQVWQDCEQAAIHAFRKTMPDPTNGAEYYMNVELVKKSRGGTLPAWWASDTDPDSSVSIGAHTFRKRK